MKQFTRGVIILIALLIVHAAACCQEDAPSTVELFPEQSAFPRLLADGSANRFSIAKDLRTRLWIGSIGGQQHIVQLKVFGLIFQTGVGGAVYVSLIRRPRLIQVMTADFFYDIPLDIRLTDRFALRTGYAHHSAHLVDDGVEILSTPSINYVKDYLPFIGSCNLPEIGGFAYGGIQFAFHSLPEEQKHWVVQCGAEAGNWVLFAGIRAYGAIDIKVKSEAGWGTTQSYQVGFKLLERGTSAVRLAFTCRTGIDDRGQFFSDRITESLLGVFFDY